MDANVTLDLGKNMTGLIEKLAASIGTTAQQVFPWYVQQAYLSAIATICGFLTIVLIFGSATFYIGRRAFHPHAGDDKGTWNFMAVISVVILGFVLAIGIPISFSEIPAFFNPEYVAMHQIIKDLSMLAGK